MNKNTRYLIQEVTKEVVTSLMKDNAIDMPEAISVFKNTNTFNKLLNPETGLYTEGSAYVYEILKDELKAGTIAGPLQ